MSRVPRVVAGELPEWEKNMNPEQLRVIRKESGSMAVYAGAGSGKTRALVHRVVRLVRHVGVSPDRIFGVTFSRAGADEMAARIRVLGVAAEMRTWHSLCGRVLKEEGVPEGRWTLDDKDREKYLVKQAGDYKHENWKGMDLTKVRSFIGMCKAHLFDAESEGAAELAKKKFGPNARRAINVYRILTTMLREQQLLTFDDMLVFVATYFAQDDEMRQRWASKFDYVLQDEAQDANKAQCTIATQLACDHRNYMIVGDPGQGIFGFRGADPAYLMDFAKDWPDAEIVTMGRNYRSGSAIVKVANDIIRVGAYRLPEDMIPERGTEGDVALVSAETLDDESEALVAHCKERLAGGGSLADVCVLYRTNAQSRALEQALLAEKMPYIIIGGVNFYERKAVKDLLAYLRLAAGRDKEGDAIRRCINAPFRYPGTRFVERVMALAGTGSWTDIVERVANEEGRQARQRESVREWVGIIEHLSDQIANGVPCEAPKCTTCQHEPGCSCVDHMCVHTSKTRPAGAADVLAYVVRATNYIEWLEREEGEESIESSHAADVREMQRVAASFTTVPDLLDFVELQVKESAANKRKRGDQCLTMMSIHRSKGLEWPMVWVVGCNENVLPHAKGDPEEERRLMYVATTRARDRLVLSHVREMATRIGVRTLDRSRFLDCLDESEELPDQEMTREFVDGGSSAVLVDMGEIGGLTPATPIHPTNRVVNGEIVDDFLGLDGVEVGRNPGSVQATEHGDAWRSAERPDVRARVFGADATCGGCGALIATHGEAC